VKDLRLLDRYRLHGRAIIDLYGWEGDETCGAFEVPPPIDGGPLRVIASGASDGIPWEHLSVSRARRCPNWAEMEHVKRLFGGDDETWVQIHVPAAEHVNMHATCLHMWRWTGGEFPRPDALLVGIGATPPRSRAEAKALHGEALRLMGDPP
jgi:hypothetical protein